MSGTLAPGSPGTIDYEEQLARIQRMNAETGKLVAEGQKFTRERSLAPLTVLFSGLTAGAALFGAGIAFAKLFWM